MPRRLRPVVIAVLGLALALLSVRACAPEPVRVATFNIEMFPNPHTDRAAVAQAIAELDAHVLALQEIVDGEAMRAVLAEASRIQGRDWRLVLGPCGGDGFRVTTGVAWDASRVQLVAARGYPGLDPSGDGVCSSDLPATAAVVTTDGGARLSVVSIHLRPFPEHYEQRKRQWPRVLTILGALRREYGGEAIAIGDFNSTGFTTGPSDERSFVERIVADADMELLTGELPCTEYWQPVPPFSELLPSLLDHAVVTGGSWEEPQALGMCERLQCRATPRPAMDPRWRSVSDHCPVVVEAAL